MDNYYGLDIDWISKFKNSIMNNQKSDIVFGYGITGKSIVQYLASLNRKITLIENKPISPEDLFFLEQHHIQIFQDEKQLKNFHNFENCYVSPGIDLRKPFFRECLDNHIQLRNDTYFLNQIDRSKTKLIAVTGTNGKTTFCTLLQNFFIKLNLKSKLVGNVGTPILDLFFSEEEYNEFIIIELSSYQIELLKEETRFDFGVILNIEPDHLDRYDSFESYRDTKISLKKFCDVILFDKESVPIKSNADKAIPLGIDESYILQSWDAKSFLFKHEEKQFRIDTPYLKGIHNIKNILYIIKLLDCACKQISLEKIVLFFSTQRGIEHRFEQIEVNHPNIFINDSKATNIASTASALNSLENNIHLIFGGELKNQSVVGLEKLFQNKLVSLNLIGKDAESILTYLNKFNNSFEINYFNSLKDVLTYLKKILKRNQIILLSPGCASKDMFKNYEDRGNQFKNLVVEMFKCN